uniref:MFS domain-containing protein n=1 Tax=Macrostomum lignano TaxID=282301 RepID=A0A1I8I7Q9_9PLAT
MQLDGGWGWMVVLSSFMLHVIIDGISYAFGVLAADLVQELGSTRQLNGWIASTLVGVTLAGGPVAGAVSARFGYRVAALAGSVIGAVGFAASYFVETAWPLVITVGCLVGFGMSLIYLPAIICVGIYFEKYRSTAIGIAVCGSGVGTLAMSPLISFLLRQYTWRGTMIILSAAVLQCAVFAALFRPFKLDQILSSSSSTDQSPPEKQLEANQPEIDIDIDNDNDKTTPLPTPGRHHQLLSPSSPHPLPIVRRASADEGGDDGGRSLLLTTMLPPGNETAKSNSSVADVADNDQLLGDGNKQQMLQQPIPAVADFLSVQDMRPRVQCQPRSQALLQPPHHQQRHHHLTSASLTNVSRPVQFVRSITSLTSVPAAGATHGSAAAGADSSGAATTTAESADAQKFFNLELLTKPVFLLFLLSNLLCSIGFNAPYIYTPDRAQRAGHEDTESALLVSVIGGANTVGRLGFGWLSDRGADSRRLQLYWASLAVSGAALAISCLSDEYAFSAACCAAFGLFSGSFVTLTSPVLVDLVGIDKLSDSFGLTLLFQGVGVLAGPPLAGLLYDWTSSFDVPFLVCGCSLIASGLVMVPAHWLLRAEQQQQQLNCITQEL